MQERNSKKYFNRPRPLCQGEDLLSYYHHLHQARQNADLTGRAFCKSEADRVKARVLFLESLETTA